MKILVTGFRPFLHHTVNSSELVLLDLARHRKDIDTLLLPVSFQNSFLQLKKFLAVHSGYDFVVMLGQANGRGAVSLERVALNWMESKNPDNDGECPAGGRILPGAPDSYLVDFFPSKWKELLSASGSEAEGLEYPAKLAEISLTAGAYVCNNLYYKAVHELRGSRTQPLFVHLPLLPEQIDENPGSPSMKLSTQSHIVSELLNLLGTRN
jgi:pyroglutamyl-peptidase